jgi:hypothetical protein
LPPGGKKGVTLVLEPTMVTQDEMDITAVAWASSGLASFVDLHVSILLPDVAIAAMGWAKEQEQWVGRKVDFEVSVLNKGAAPASVDVWMFTNDPEQEGGPVMVTLGPGEEANVTFSYTHMDTIGNLTVVVDRYNMVHESNEDNNVKSIIDHAKHAPGGELPGFDISLGLMACILAGLTLAARSRHGRDA